MRIFAASRDLWPAAAQEIFGIISTTLGARHRCNIALAGGSTPRSLYSVIAEHVAEDVTLRQITWERVHFFFTDERCVPGDHPDSNYKMVMDTLFSHGSISGPHIHRIRTELGPEKAAEDYERRLLEHFHGPPSFDVVLLGIGSDGHTASLFAGTEALRVARQYVWANFIPRLDAHRITLTLAALNAAAHVLFLVSGAEKAQAVAAVLAKGSDLPGALVKPAGRLTWFLDKEAASSLRRD